MLPSIPTDAEIKVMPRKKLKQLPENVLTGIHAHPPKVPGGYHRSKFKSKTKNYVKEQYNSITWRYPLKFYRTVVLLTNESKRMQ
jgi:hypothetical protein